MSDLIAIAYDDEFTASEVLQRLERARKQHLIELDDAVVVLHDEEGKVRLKQTHNLVAAGATSGGLWGLLVGLVFLNPLIGIAAGAASGAVAGHFIDIGIDDKFMKELGERLSPGSSALFLLVRKMTPDKVLPLVQEFGGHVMQTSLSTEQEQKLQEALSGQARVLAETDALGEDADGPSGKSRVDPDPQPSALPPRLRPEGGSQQ